jgi:hypothetical protein
MRLSAELPGLLLIGTATIGFFYVYLCLRDGVVLNRGMPVDRRKQPRLYWLLMMLLVILSIAVLLMGIDTFGAGRRAV